MTGEADRGKTQKNFRELQNSMEKVFGAHTAKLLRLFKEPQLVEFVLGRGGIIWIVQATDLSPLLPPPQQMGHLVNQLKKSEIGVQECLDNIAVIPVSRKIEDRTLYEHRCSFKKICTADRRQSIGQGDALGEIIVVKDTRSLDRLLPRQPSHDVIAIVEKMDRFVGDAIINHRIQGLIILSGQLPFHYETWLRVLNIPTLLLPLSDRWGEYTRTELLKQNHKNGLLRIPHYWEGELDLVWPDERGGPRSYRLDSVHNAELLQLSPTSSYCADAFEDLAKLLPRRELRRWTGKKRVKFRTAVADVDYDAGTVKITRWVAGGWHVSVSGDVTTRELTKSELYGLDLSKIYGERGRVPRRRASAQPAPHDFRDAKSAI